MIRKNVILRYQIVCFCFLSSIVIGQDFKGAIDLGWKTGSQAYTFKFFTLEETLEKLNELKLKYVELVPGQKIGTGSNDLLDHKMKPKDREFLRELLVLKGVSAVAYGVVDIEDEREWEIVFDFAKAIGITIITAEPSFDHLDLIEGLAIKYNIKVAFHNHKIPRRFWHPDIILNVLEGRSEMLGACADIGHWIRSGLNPLECLKKLEGRVISLHLKDLNTYKNSDNQIIHDVPWGTGVSNISGILHELKRQEFMGLISVEYEYNWLNNIPEIRESLIYFDKVSKAISQIR